MVVRPLRPCLSIKKRWLAVSVLLLAISAFASDLRAQEESRLHLFRERQISSGYFEDVDVTSFFYMPLVGGPKPGRRYLKLPPKAGTHRRWRTFLADSHYGIKIRPLQTCEDCHPEQARNLHTVRARITCFQCHGYEPIPGINHYYSSMNPTRRHSYVCAKCHEGANNSYATYVVHSPNPMAVETLQTFPMLFYAFWLILVVAAGTLAVFVPHTALWGIRELLAGHRQRSTRRIQRFSPGQRAFHFLLMLSFLTQAATGFSRTFIETRWGKALADIFGGYQPALLIHQWVGLFMLTLFGAHLLYLLWKIRRGNINAFFRGPDTLLPRWADLRQAIQHVGWFVGRSDPPRFDRWGYWEKFDYWAVFWGITILGGTGLFLMFSLEVTRVVPGWALNVAFWIHRIEALLAIAHVFVIHFFIAHLRRHSFPMDRAMFEGSVNLDAAIEEKPEWVERLRKSGKLDQALVPRANRYLRLLYYLIGFSVVAAGLLLLVGGLINSTRITW